MFNRLTCKNKIYVIFIFIFIINKTGCSAIGSVYALGACGCRFESCHSENKKKKLFKNKIKKKNFIKAFKIKALLSGWV